MARRRTPSILSALTAALTEAPPEKRDAATVALAKRYALELDDAAVISTAANKALRQLSQLDDVDTELFEKFEALAVRIEEVHVATTVGPKLLAVLEQLNLTPKARNAVVTPTGGGGGSAGNSALGQLRERRENRTQAVDPSAS
jgi:hypothetical protein